MNLKTAIAPHIRKTDSARSVMLDVLIPLTMLLIVPLMYNGARVFVLTGVSIVSAMVFETLFCVLSHRPVTLSDLSAIVTGFIISVMLPVSAPLWLPVVACGFAILIVKMPFGGLGRSPFNPAAAGLAFVTICFPGEVFRYRDTKLISNLDLFASPDFTGALSPAAMLHSNTRPDIYPTEMALGNYPGPMGTTAILVILACAVYLIMRRTVAWQTPVCFIGTAALYALLFPRIPGNRIDSVIFEMLSGSLVFAAVFMATEPSTSPKSNMGRAIYGALGGLICMLLRTFGAYEQGACFAILIINSVSSEIDFAVLKLRKLAGGVPNERFAR